MKGRGAKIKGMGEGKNAGEGREGRRREGEEKDEWEGKDEGRKQIGSQSKFQHMFCLPAMAHTWSLLSENIS